MIEIFSFDTMLLELIDFLMGIRCIVMQIYEKYRLRYSLIHTYMYIYIYIYIFIIILIVPVRRKGMNVFVPHGSARLDENEKETGN